MENREEDGAWLEIETRAHPASVDAAQFTMGGAVYKERAPKNEQLEALIAEAMNFARKFEILKFGEFGAPLSKQLFGFIRSVSPAEDHALFDKIDTTKSRAIAKALWMRLVTFLLYLALALAFVSFSMCFKMHETTSGEPPPAAAVSTPNAGASEFLVSSARAIISKAAEMLFGEADLGELSLDEVVLSYLGVVLAFCLLLYGARGYFRKFHFLSDIASMADRLKADFFGHMQKLSGENCRAKALREATNRRSEYLDGPNVAANWLVVAAWYEDRMEQVDRYATTAGWKIQERFNTIERFFVVVNLAVFICAIILVFSSPFGSSDVAPLKIVATILGATVYGFFAVILWSFTDRQGNDMFLRLLRGEGHGAATGTSPASDLKHYEGVRSAAGYIQ